MLLSLFRASIPDTLTSKLMVSLSHPEIARERVGLTSSSVILKNFCHRSPWVRTDMRHKFLHAKPILRSLCLYFSPFFVETQASLWPLDLGLFLLNPIFRSPLHPLCHLW